MSIFEILVTYTYIIPQFRYFYGNFFEKKAAVSKKINDLFDNVSVIV